MTVATPVEVLTRERFDADVRERVREAGEEELGSGWWCVRTLPFPCPAEGCSFVALFLTAAHLVVVYPERDDSVLLKHAAQAQELGRDPRVVEYRSEFGPCISLDRWRHVGRPVHAKIDAPPAYAGRWLS